MLFSITDLLKRKFVGKKAVLTTMYQTVRERERESRGIKGKRE